MASSSGPAHLIKTAEIHSRLQKNRGTQLRHGELGGCRPQGCWWPGDSRFHRDDGDKVAVLVDLCHPLSEWHPVLRITLHYHGAKQCLEPWTWIMVVWIRWDLSLPSSPIRPSGPPGTANDGRSHFREPGIFPLISVGHGVLLPGWCLNNCMDDKFIILLTELCFYKSNTHHLDHIPLINTRISRLWDNESLIANRLPLLL